jgi:hypothetical protein
MEFIRMVGLHLRRLDTSAGALTPSGKKFEMKIRRIGNVQTFTGPVASRVRLKLRKGLRSSIYSELTAS